MDAAHTPTPWVWIEKPTTAGTVFKVGSQQMVDGTHGGICLYDDHTARNPRAPGEQQANAEFIVRACNAHYMLRNLLEEAARRVLEDPAGDHGLADRIANTLSELASGSAE
jgi:hypothetical protein